MDKSEMVWITWERQTRNRSMATMLGVGFHEILSAKKGLARYAECIKQTHRILRDPKVKVAFVQNPSMVLTAYAVLTKRLYNVRVVVDAHNAGVFPAEGRYGLLNTMNRKLLQGSDLVIVTNEDLGRATGADYLVCTDPLPDIELKAQPVQNDVLVVCSWSEDEPIEEYIEAARLFPELNFMFTGNYKKYEKELDAPQNCHFLGFVTESEYYAYMAGAELVLDMTKRDNCLVCGAYEAIAMDKVAVVTDNHTNRAVFGDAVLYAELSSRSIAEAIDGYFIDENRIRSNLLRFKSFYSEQSNRLAQNVHQRVLQSATVN